MIESAVFGIFVLYVIALIGIVITLSTRRDRGDWTMITETELKTLQEIRAVALELREAQRAYFASKPRSPHLFEKARACEKRLDLLLGLEQPPAAPAVPPMFAYLDQYEGDPGIGSGGG